MLYFFPYKLFLNSKTTPTYKKLMACLDMWPYLCLDGRAVKRTGLHN